MTLTNTDTNPLWDFSLALYDRDGVAPACLELQAAAGVDVNLLLFCSWRAWQGIALERADLQAIDEGIADWREDVVLPIRALRQRLKDYPGVDSSRMLIKQAELEAERAQQQRMYQLSQGQQADTDADRDVLEYNLQQFAAFQGIEASRLAAFSRLAALAFRNLKVRPIAL